jgi:hypothetical protein
LKLIHSTMRLLLSLSLALAAAACGGDAPDPSGKTCPTVRDTDAGDLTALKAQRCNVSGTMGAKNWYRLSATLPDAPGNVVQVELWPERGSFRGGPVKTGTFQLTTDDLDFATCGVCLRAMADKGGPDQREYFAVAGTVEVTAVASTEGAPFVATILEASFAEVDKDRAEVAGGCSADLARAKISGVVMIQGGGGGGGGGGGSGGMGGCLTTVGD